MIATAKDLRFYSKEILETVARGEEVIITFHGKAKAKIIPIDEKEQLDSEQNELFGMWKNNDEVKDINGYVRKLRKGRY